MNKLIKGSIAGAAGIALLLGGAGTLAVWNSSTTLDSAGAITAGTLEITGTNGGGWDQNLDLIVPGDTLTYSETLTLSATGDNLEFAVSDNVASLVSASTFSNADVTSTVTVKLDGATVTPNASGNYDAAAGAYTIDVSIVVDFPETTTGTTDQGAVLNLAAAAVTVTQVAP